MFARVALALTSSKDASGEGVRVARTVKVWRHACVTVLVCSLVSTGTPASKASFPGTAGSIAIWGEAGVSLIDENGNVSKLGVEESLPSWDPTGRRLAVVGSGLRGSEIWILDDQGEVQQKVQLVYEGVGIGGISNGPPSWSPDGTMMTFSGKIADDSWQYAFVVDLVSSRVERLTESETGWELGPRWSPDGSKIAFTQDTVSEDGLHSCCKLVVTDPDGSAPEVLTETAQLQGSMLDWSPDGNKLVFTDSDTISEIDVHTGETRLLYQWSEAGACGNPTTIGCTWIASPVWSPEGDRVGFVVAENSPGWTPFRLFTVKTDGSQLTLLSEGNFWPPISWQAINPSDLSVFADGPESAAIGDEITYTVTVSNAGPEASSGAEVTAELPPGLVAGLDDSGTPGGPGRCIAEDEVTVSCQVGPLGVGESVTLEVPALVKEAVAQNLDEEEGTRSRARVSARVAFGPATWLRNLFRVVVRAYTYDPALGNNLARFRNHICPRAILYSARGSGESPGFNYGLGSPGASLYRALNVRSGLRRSSLIPVAVRYPATSVDWKAIAHHRLGLVAKYLDSVSAGVRRGVQDLKDFASWCSAKKTRILVVGYSQGAHVIRRVLAKVKTSQTVRAMVRGVRLFGDPMFKPEELAGFRLGNLGGFRPGKHGILRLRFLPITQFDAIWRSRIKTWCNRGDLVCQGLPGSFKDHRYDSQAREKWFVDNAIRALTR